MNKFLKVMQSAATDRGLTLDVGRGETPTWAALTAGAEDDRVTVEVGFHGSIKDGEYWTADVFEWIANKGDDRSELIHKAFGSDTASLFRLLGTWLG